MTLRSEYTYGGDRPNVGDDEFHWENLPPEILGGTRDYIARNLKVTVEAKFAGIEIALQLEGVVIHEAKVDLGLPR